MISRREYLAIHAWIRYKFGSANMCESDSCAGLSKRYEWALRRGCVYTRIRSNFIMLCKRCHIIYDEHHPEKLHSLRDKATFDRIQTAKYKPVSQFDRLGNLINKWPSSTHAQQELGISRSAIGNTLKGLSKTAGGYIWRNG